MDPPKSACFHLMFSSSDSSCLQLSSEILSLKKRRLQCFGVKWHEWLHIKVPLFQMFSNKEPSSSLGFTRQIHIHKSDHKRFRGFQSIVLNTIRLILNWRHFILILRWRSEWLYTHSSCWLWVINVFHVQLFRFNPADLDGEEFAVVFSRSTVWCGSSSSWSTRPWCRW